MNAPALLVHEALAPRPLTANERFHRSFAAVFWLSLMLATGAHFALFRLWPAMSITDISYAAEELTAIELPPEIRIPEAPTALARPAVPVMATTDISEDITIAPTTFAANPVETLLTPPTQAEVRTEDLAAAPVFTPYTVRPDVRNRAEIQRVLREEYPPLLRDAGIGGTVLVWFFIDEEGGVVRTLVAQTSGFVPLDEAALKVANVIEFTPALNRDKRVSVWISLPITFTVR